MAWCDIGYAAKRGVRRVLRGSGSLGRHVRLEVLEEAIILGMRAEPEPGDLITLQEPEGAVSQSDASRVDRLAYVNSLELQAWMLDVIAKEPIRLTSRFLDLGWQVAIRRPEARRRTRCHRLSGSSSV